MPSAPIAVLTTGRPAANASRIFNRVPPPASRGTARTVASSKYGRTSGTVPVTMTPGVEREVLDVARRIAAENQETRVREFVV